MKRVTHAGRCRWSHSTPRSVGLVRVSLIGLTLLAGEVVQAAPVTLQFDAIIGTPLAGFSSTLPPQWNVSLQQGDTITGTFTFDPLDAPSNSATNRVIQAHDFTFYIKGRTLTSAQFGIEVFDNRFGIDDEGINPSDDMYIGCSAGINTPSCLPAILSTPDTLTWSAIAHHFRTVAG